MSETSTVTTSAAGKTQGFSLVRLLLEGRAFFALIVIVAVFSLLSPNYLTVSNFLIMASHVAIYGILAIVADNGPGIPPDMRERACNRFVRLESSRTTAGNGLGLSLVAAIVHLHSIGLDLGDNHPGLRVSLRFPSRAT